MLKQNKGITLVALVITIIVLLILAGVSISLVIGDNGVMSQAQKASKNTSEGDARQAVQVAISSCQAEFSNAWSGNTNVPLSDYITVAKMNDQLKAYGYKITTPASGVVADGTGVACTMEVLDKNGTSISTSDTSRYTFTLKTAGVMGVEMLNFTKAQ